MKKIAVLAAGLAFACSAWAEEPPAFKFPSWAALQLGEPISPAKGEEAMRDIEANKSYAIPALEIVGFDTLLNLYDRQRFGCCDFHSNLHTIRDNLRSRWDVDSDPFKVNQLGHPYQGSMYHGFARASGLSYWEALTYTFAGSAFWEIAGERTPPSRNDQINTGIGGQRLRKRDDARLLEGQGIRGPRLSRRVGPLRHLRLHRASDLSRVEPRRGARHHGPVVGARFGGRSRHRARGRGLHRRRLDARHRRQRLPLRCCAPGAGGSARDLH